MKVGTIEHAYIAIVHCQRAAGHEWPSAIPLIVKVLKGIRRRPGTRKRKMAPLEIGDLKKCLAVLRERRIDDLTVVRDRCILALGFFGGFRRAEIVGLHVEDIAFVPEGLVVTLRKSKTDQDKAGTEVALPACKDESCCPAALTRAYLKLSELKTGPLFRRIDSRSDCMGDRAVGSDLVAAIVKNTCERAGLDPVQFAAHSLRAGFATTAAKKGKSIDAIMRQGRWKDQRVAMGYIRPATLFDHNAAAGLGDEEDGE
jgi:integrase